MEPYHYLEYREVFGRHANIAALIQIVRKYPLKHWLGLLSRLEYFHQSREQDFHSIPFQRGLAEKIFPASMIKQIRTFELREGRKMSPSIFFTYPQLLNLRRLAILHAPEESQESLLSPPIPVDAAEAFLLMNELSDSIEPNGERPDQANLHFDRVLELIIRQFFLNHQPFVRHLLGRYELMLLDLPTRLRADPDYLDIEAEFSSACGVGLRDYCSWLWALLAQWASRVSESPPWSPWIEVEEYLGKVKPDLDMVAQVMKLVSSPLDELRRRVEEDNQKYPNHWAYSTLPMQETPFVEISPGRLSLLGLNFGYDKIATGIYYLLEARLNPSKQDKLSAFFGKICQRYFEEQCEHFLGKAFAKERKYDGPNGRLNGPDGMVEAGTTLYVFEVKSSPLRLRTKTTGSLQLLLEDAAKRRHGFLRAAEQLDRAIAHFQEGRFQAFGKSSLHFHSIIPVVVMLEPVPEEPHVLSWIGKEIRSRGLCQQMNVGEVQIMSFESLERLLPAARRHGFGEVMAHKMGTPRFNREGYHEFIRERYADARNELVDVACNRFVDEAIIRVLKNAPPEDLDRFRRSQGT